MEGSSLREVIFTPLTGMRPTSLDGSKSRQVTSKVPWTIVSPGDGGVKGRLRGLAVRLPAGVESGRRSNSLLADLTQIVSANLD